MVYKPWLHVTKHYSAAYVQLGDIGVGCNSNKRILELNTAYWQGVKPASKKIKTRSKQPLSPGP